MPPPNLPPGVVGMLSTCAQQVQDNTKMIESRKGCKDDIWFPCSAMQYSFSLRAPQARTLRKLSKLGVFQGRTRELGTGCKFDRAHTSKPVSTITLVRRGTNEWNGKPSQVEEPFL